MARLGTKLAMSTAHHPQTDGQTERANRTFEDMLRAYVSPYHDDWDQHLAALEFAYNTSVHASTGFTPAYLNYGQHPDTPLSLQVYDVDPTPRDANAEAFVGRMAKDLELARARLKEAQERQAEYYNKGRRQHNFRVGDKVLLSHKFTEHLPIVVAVPGAAPKLGARGWGPFEVTEVINDIAIRLKLPVQWKMHPVVSASYLIPFRESPVFPDREPPAPDPEVVDGEDHFLVDKILNHQHFGRLRHLRYLVSYAGYGPAHNEWQFASDLAEDISPDAFAKLELDYQQSRNLPDDYRVWQPTAKTVAAKEKVQDKPATQARRQSSRKR